MRVGLPEGLTFEAVRENVYVHDAVTGLRVKLAEAVRVAVRVDGVWESVGTAVIEGFGVSDGGERVAVAETVRVGTRLGDGLRVGGLALALALAVRRPVAEAE